MLEGKRVIVGVTGSIAAYKAADLVSKLTQAGAEVDVILTEAGAQFITPMALRSLSGRPVYTDIFDLKAELAISHVELARRADAVVIAPVSATTLARLAHGFADNLLSLTVLATQAPVLLAPAMDSQMYENAATQANLALLKERGMTIVGPVEGRLASGRVGRGRMVEAEVILGALRQMLGRNGDLAGRKVVVSAGGTQEPIDPVRYVGNRSSGKMGYAIAEAARDRGARVTLVSAPVALPAPYGVELVAVKTADEMRDAVVAAVRRRRCPDHGGRRRRLPACRHRRAEDQAAKAGLTLELARTPDILAAVKGEARAGGVCRRERGAAEERRREAGRQGAGVDRGQRYNSAGIRVRDGHESGDDHR